jgi:hypothetical protein
MIKSALLIVLFAAPLFAQSGRPAALGDRVRVRAPNAGYGQLTGNVVATTPDAIQVRLDGGTEVAVMREQIDALFLSLRSRRNTVRGAIIGTIVGGGVAFLFGPKKVAPNQPPGTGKVSAINVVTAAVGGAGVGGLVGYYTRSDLWVPMSPRP